MVLPDGVRESDNEAPRGTSRHLLVLGALTLVLGVAVLGGLGTASPESSDDIPVPPTTPPIADAEWEQVEEMPQADAYNLLVFRDEVLVFTSTALDEEIPLQGLRVWRSNDGRNWEPGEDSVIDVESRVHTVTSTALGIVALGFVPYNDAERAWLSIDGDYWMPLMDGLPLDSAEFLRTNSPEQTPDTATTIGDVEEEFGRDARVVRVAATGEQTIALVSRPPDRGRPYDLGTVEIWTSTH